MNLKNTIRKALIFLHLDVTQNLRYDRLTQILLRRFIKPDSNCIDVGCHKGEVLELMLKCAPSGRHYAFEPIPYLFSTLEKEFKGKAAIYPYALSDSNGETTFQFVRNAPAYSGIKKRRYDIAQPEIEEITVVKKKLDEILPESERIDFVKIDVEGGEFGVLKGARNILKKNKPIILFECGKGASDFYGTEPRELYNFLFNEIGLKIYTLRSFVNNLPALSEDEFSDCFHTNKEYYFVAGKATGELS